MERGSTDVAESLRIGDLGSADTTVGTNSTGTDAYRSWRRVAYGKVQRVCVGLRGDVGRFWRNVLTPAVGVLKCEMGAGAHRGGKVVLGRCAHDARGRDATDGVAVNTRISLPVVGGMSATSMRSTSSVGAVSGGGGACMSGE